MSTIPLFKAVDYGVTGDGVTQDRPALNAAIAAANSYGKGLVELPSGNILIDDEIALTSANVGLIGQGDPNTTILQSANNKKILNATGFNASARGLSLKYSGTPVAGATALYAGSNFKFSDFVVQNGYVGIECAQAGGVMGRSFRVNGCGQIGVWAHGVSDCYFEQFEINGANDPNKLTLGGIRLQDKAEAVHFSNGSILTGRYGITADAVVNGPGTRPAYCTLTNIFADSAANEGAYLMKMFETDFIGCWFSGGRTGAGFAGMYGNELDSVTFSNTRFFNCGKHGADFAANCKRIAITACAADSNSITAGANIGNGFNFQAGMTDFIVSHSIARNGGYPGGQQGWGVKVAAGASDRYIVADNLVSGNGLGGVSDGGTGTNKRVANNY